MLLVLNIQLICECSATSGNDIRVTIKKIVEKIDGYKIFTRRYGYSDSDYVINVFSDEIKLCLRKYNDNDYKELMIIDDDKNIEEYFKNIDFNISIDKLYKDLEGYLGNIDCYNEIRLEINKIRNNKKINTDLLLLRKGVCCEFMITRDNRCIYLNNNGEWSYNYIDRFYRVSSVGKNDKDITYSINADNDSILKYYIDTKVRVEDVVEEVDDTKKLVRGMFSKNNR